MTVLPRYRIEGAIGIGAAGPVHRAVAERLGAREVALRPALVTAGPERDELRWRAEAIALLGCPRLAVVDDIVELDDDRVQLAGTLGRHGNLADRLLLGPLSVDDAVATMRPIIEALAVAHGAGLVHGHLSPTNVVFGDHGPIVTDLVLPPVGRPTAADDVAALATLATALVDADDPSPAVATYRSVWARVAAGSTVPLGDITRALARVPSAVPQPLAVAPATPTAVGVTAPASSATMVAAAIGIAGGVGLTIGAAAAWLPALIG